MGNSKLTPELHERLIAALRAGNYIETACAFAGIVPATYHRWMKEAETAPEGDPRRELKDAATKARADAEVRSVRLVQKAAEKPAHWTAAAWFLERSHPQRWGRTTRMEVTGADGGPVRIAASVSELESLVDDILGRDDSEA